MLKLPHRLAALAVTTMACVCVLALASFDPAQIPGLRLQHAAAPANLVGPTGAALAHGLFTWLGKLGAYAAVTALLAAGLWGLGRRGGPEAASPAPDGAAPWPSLAFVRPLGVSAALLAVAVAEHLLARDGLLSIASTHAAGGLWGMFLAERLPATMPPNAGYAMAATTGAIGLILALDLEVGRLLAPRPRTDAKGARGRDASPSAVAVSPPPAPAPRPAAAPPPTPPAPAPAVSPEPAPLPPPAPARAPVPAAASEPSPAPSPACAPAPAPAPTPAPSPPSAPTRPDPVAAAKTDPLAELPDEVDIEPIPLLARPLSPRRAEPPSPEVDEDLDEELDDDLPARADHLLPPDHEPTIPPVTLLTAAPAGEAAGVLDERLEHAREKARVLVQALADFRIPAQMVSIERGPNVTRYELELAKGVKVNRVLGLENDIQLALQAQAVRIVAPIPGRGTVGIEVPNRDQDTVLLRELIEHGIHDLKGHAIPLFLGKDATGAPLVADLARMPHLLIAGATGSGKSVCMNAIICSILATRAPDLVKLLLIDPKMVELSMYHRVPHLLAPVVTDMRRAAQVLEWAVEKMDERYALLSRAKVRHVKTWNALGPKALAERLRLPEEALRERRIPAHMPYIVLVIDEFADLMCVARKEVEGSIIRLAQKSRAVGIHLILATQRPTADVITGLIKSNMPCRLAFQVASKLDSRTILDKNGAECLVGQGDMLYLPPGTSHTVRAQGTYVGDDEVKALCDHLAPDDDAEPAFEDELTDAPSGAAATAKDELFDRAVDILLETGRGSASLLQRRLEVGYARASRLIDQMTDAGILGPFKGSKAREILFTREQWEAMKRQVARETAGEA